MPNNRVAIPPPILWLVPIFAAMGLQHLIPLSISGSKLLTWIGNGIAIVALALMVLVVYSFYRHQNNIDVNADNDRLMTSGPFRLSRNPFYLGMLIMTIGFAFKYNNPWLFLAALTAFFLLDALVIKKEERKLEQKFGAGYREYCGRVRRWV